MVKGRLHSFETFGAVDGPGIRTVVFLQGCPARCAYCHNPDTWDVHGGSEVETKQIVDRAKRGMSYYGEKGGVTFSGGEPLLQGEFLIQTIRALKKVGINSIIDTSGTYIDEFTEKVIEECEMVLLDVKHSQPEKFWDITGKKQDNLLKLIDLINKHGKHVWVRQVIVPGINDSQANIKSLNEFIKRITHVDKVELLGYHNLGVEKYEKLGIKYRLKDVEPMDQKELNKLSALVSF
ncbi:pyruvate formate-lyase-activating protein [Aminipila terrae]|uniref:Pyruvate formate-lyase-activating enzyme n=1 Tax=Aminipila terrae TaxID=2697030 RepID=A0A6P1MGK7_9FIRM|nr:pyruvate formate-lyase-activating protein [Aminipila terrae]QHI73027.1 pyruvate formate lyase-activating protein [Aminipila terrae]